MAVSVSRRSTLLAILSSVSSGPVASLVGRALSSHKTAGHAASSQGSGNRTWLSGYYGSGDASTRAAWATAYRPPQVWTSFTDFESTWTQRAAHIRGNQSQYSPPVSDGTTINVLTIGLTLSGSDGSQQMNETTLRAAAAGEDILGWLLIGDAISAAGLDSPSTVIRLGHEPNGNWYPWATGNNPFLMGLYRRAWQFAQRTVRTICPHVRFDLCLNAQTGGYAAITGHYPGDQYVDIIGLDFYDFVVSKSTRQFSVAQGSCGITNIAAFAASHGKKIALDEWAVGPNPNVGTRDNPFFVQSIFASLLAAQGTSPGLVSYDSYFNAKNLHNLTLNPQCAAVYRDNWD